MVDPPLDLQHDRGVGATRELESEGGGCGLAGPERTERDPIRPGAERPGGSEDRHLDVARGELAAHCDVELHVALDPDVTDVQRRSRLAAVGEDAVLIDLGARRRRRGDHEPEGCGEEQVAHGLGGMREPWPTGTGLPMNCGARGHTACAPLGGTYSPVMSSSRSDDMHLTAADAWRALEEVHVGVYLQDFVRGDHVWSPTTYAIFGVPRDYPIGADSLLQLILPEDQPHLLRQVGAAHDPGAGVSGYTVRFRIKRPDGEVRYAEAKAWLERDESGAVQREWGALRDVSDSQALRNQLVLAQRDEVLGRIAGGIAHDFNNLLTIILGQASRLRLMLGAGETPTGEELDVLDDAARRGASLTRGLLGFAGDRSGSAEPRDIAKIVAANEGLLRRAIGEGRELAFEYGSDVPPAVVDTSQIEQLLLNLTLNAKDATEPGGVIRVRVERTVVDADSRLDVAPGPFVKIVVSDTGRGMEAETLERALDAFFTTKRDGTGLGLATCRLIAEARQGTLSIESTPGDGTTVTVLLPADPLAEVRDGARRQRHEQPVGDGLTVLLVEDEPLVRDLTARALDGFGFSVVLAGTAPEALEQVEARAFDVAICDVVLPGRMDAAELRAAIATRRPDLPVLFVSGYAAMEKGRSLSDVMHPEDRFLAKPYTPVTLADVLREMLRAATRS